MVGLLSCHGQGAVIRTLLCDFASLLKSLRPQGLPPHQPKPEGEKYKTSSLVALPTRRGFGNIPNWVSGTKPSTKIIHRNLETIKLSYVREDCQPYPPLIVLGTALEHRGWVKYVIPCGELAASPHVCYCVVAIALELVTNTR